jgi:hypothetical protein
VIVDIDVILPAIVAPAQPAIRNSAVTYAGTLRSDAVSAAYQVAIINTVIYYEEALSWTGPSRRMI